MAQCVRAVTRSTAQKTTKEPDKSIPTAEKKLLSDKKTAPNMITMKHKPPKKSDFEAMQPNLAGAPIDEMNSIVQHTQEWFRAANTVWFRAAHTRYPKRQCYKSSFRWWEFNQYYDDDNPYTLTAQRFAGDTNYKTQNTPDTMTKSTSWTNVKDLIETLNRLAGLLPISCSN